MMLCNLCMTGGMQALCLHLGTTFMAGDCTMGPLAGGPGLPCGRAACRICSQVGVSEPFSPHSCTSSVGAGSSSCISPPLVVQGHRLRSDGAHQLDSQACIDSDRYDSSINGQFSCRSRINFFPWPAPDLPPWISPTIASPATAQLPSS